MRPTVSRSFCPCSIRVNFARLVLSQSCSAVLAGWCPSELRIISLMLSFSAATSPCGVDLDRPGQITLGHRRRHVRDRAHLGREVRSQLVHVVRKVFPCPGSARHRRPGRRAFLPRRLRGPPSSPDPRTWPASRSCVDGVRELGDFTFRLDEQLPLQVTVRDRGHDLGNAAHLVGEVARHEIHVVGEILPRARHTLHVRLAAELALAYPPRAPPG